jgi:hypothetical protein
VFKGRGAKQKDSRNPGSKEMVARTKKNENNERMKRERSADRTDF